MKRLDDKMIRLFSISILLLINIEANSQESQVQDSSFIYWTNSRIISFNDFQQIPDSHAIRLMTKYNVKSLTNVQIHCILDYPKNKRDMKTLGELWYFAPVFCKSCSPILVQDSLELKYALMYFDIAEYCTRITRKKIAEFLDKNPGKGIIAAIFPRLTDETYKLMREMFASFSKQVIDDKTPGSFEDWRENLNKMLENTKELRQKKKNTKGLSIKNLFQINIELSTNYMGKMFNAIFSPTGLFTSGQKSNKTPYNTDNKINKLVTVFAFILCTLDNNWLGDKPGLPPLPIKTSVTGDNNRRRFGLVPRHCASAHSQKL